jgi:transposase
VIELTDNHQHGYRHGSQLVRPGAEGPLRVELITGRERRRKWTMDDKGRITAESLEPGVNVSEIARRHGVSVGLLHHWRKCAREGDKRSPMRFVPVTVAGEVRAPGAARPEVSRSSIEIEYGGVLIRVNGAVDAGTLRTVMAAVQGRR